MKRKTGYGFVALWLAVAAGAVLMHHFREVNADFLGVVETRTHKLGAREAGRVKQFQVSLGDPVEAGQLLATLDTADLDTQREWLDGQVKALRESLDADRVRFTLEYQRLRLQGDASRAGLAERRAGLEAKRAELKAIDAEIERLARAEKAGLGRPRNLDDLRIRQAEVARFVREAGRAVPADVPEDPPSRGASSDAEGYVRSMLSERLEHVTGMEMKLKELDVQREGRLVYSPCAGRVVDVKALPGDILEKFAPLLTIEEPQAAFLDVYIPETSDFQPRLGQRVRVHPHRGGAAMTGGTVAFIDPGYSAIPQRLAVRNLLYWARKFRVRLDADHGLMPGEAAKVEMLDDGDGFLSMGTGTGQGG